MARSTDKGISGAVGNLVFYTMNGNNYVRSKPGKRTKKRNKDPNPLNTIFGIVSSYGSPMISQLRTVLLFPFSINTYNSIRGWMRNQYAAHGQDAIWELTAQGTAMCQVNRAIDLRDFLTVPLSVSDTGNSMIKISIPSLNPAKNIKAPSHTNKVNLKLVAVSSPFGQKTGSSNFCMEQYSFDYTNEILAAKEIVLNTSAITGSIVIVVAAIEFDEGDKMYNTDVKWLPAAIIGMGRLK